MASRRASRQRSTKRTSTEGALRDTAFPSSEGLQPSPPCQEEQVPSVSLVECRLYLLTVDGRDTAAQRSVATRNDRLDVAHEAARESGLTVVTTTGDIATGIAGDAAEEPVGPRCIT